MDEARIQENFSWERMELIRLAMANDQVVLAENKRREKIEWTVRLAIISAILTMVGVFMTEKSRNPESLWSYLTVFGFFTFITIVFMWRNDLKRTSKKRKTKKKK